MQDVFYFYEKYNMKTVLVFLLFSFTLFSQSKRDIFIKDSVINYLNDISISNADYNLLKNRIFQLDKAYGYETDFHFKLLKQSFKNNDLKFFKQDLIFLIKYYGFNINYLKGNELYFDSILNGSLSKWFRKKYVKNHSKWLKNNLSKSIDIQNMHNLKVKDQVLSNFVREFNLNKDFDSIQKNIFIQHTNNYYLKNIADLHFTANKYGFLPNSKNFALTYFSYETVLIHNLRENTDTTWDLFFPYFKKAYLNNEITNVVFSNYDFYHYSRYGTQVFNSFSLDQIPESFRKGGSSIPLKDEAFYHAIKKEFKWK